MAIDGVKIIDSDTGYDIYNYVIGSYKDGVSADKIVETMLAEEKAYPGEVFFKDCDLDMCDVLIFNKTLGEGRFYGKAIELQQFMDEYAGSEFEIIKEGYFGNTTTYTGWLWEDGKQPVSAIMYIWNRGDMVYRVEK